MSNTTQDTASPWRRLLAGTIDLVLLAAVWFVFSYAWSVRSGALERDQPASFLSDWGWPGIWLAALIIALAGAWALFRATPGAALAGCELARYPQGDKIGWVPALVRAVLFLLSLAPVGLGFWWCFFDRRRAALYDILTDTYVRVEDESRLPLPELERAVLSEETRP